MIDIEVIVVVFFFSPSDQEPPYSMITLHEMAETGKGKVGSSFKHNWNVLYLEPQCKSISSVHPNTTGLEVKTEWFSSPRGFQDAPSNVALQFCLCRQHLASFQFRCLVDDLL